MGSKIQAPETLFSDEISVWAKHASCLGFPVDWWFPENFNLLDGRISTMRAKEVCKSCIVKQQCLKYADENDEVFGIWGGKTPTERGYKRMTRTIKTVSKS